MPGLELRSVWLPSHVPWEPSKLRLRCAEGFFSPASLSDSCSKPAIVDPGREGAWDSHFVPVPLSGQIIQLWGEVSQQGQVRNQPCGAGLGRPVFKGLWRHGTVSVREMVSQVLFLWSSCGVWAGEVRVGSRASCLSPWLIPASSASPGLVAPALSRATGICCMKSLTAEQQRKPPCSLS